MRKSLVLLVLVCGLLTGSRVLMAQQPWKAVAIPDQWKRPPAEIQSKGNGFAWYVCRFRAPADWAKQRPELFAEPADDARQYFLDGTRVASCGVFPPQYRSGLGSADRYAIPPKAWADSAEHTMAIRLYLNASRTNFNVAAPVIFAGDDAIRLRGKWSFHVGDLQDLDLLANVEAAFVGKIEAREIVEATLKKLDNDAGPQTTAQALEKFKVPDDLAVDLVLSDPDIGQPLSVKFDAKGRLWVVEYLQYPNPAGLTMLSRDKYLRTVYDKVPAAPPNHFPGADKITIHEDRDGDGYFETHKTFVDGLSLVSSFAIGGGGVWVLNPPYLLFYPDKDGDDVPDGDPEVRLQGFGMEDSHSIANSIRWGPDGWLYAAQGSTVTGQVRAPSDKPTAAVHSMGQLIWRYHPTARKYEIFAEGGGNTFGVEIDSDGRVYSGHNGGDTRGFHYVQGGYYRKGFGKHGELSNPYAYGYFAAMAHHKVLRFTHTFIFYEADALPKKYQGQLFGVQPLLSHVVISDVSADRSSFRTKDIGYAIESSDPWFRPVDVQLGPDGSIYVADLYEQRIDHASHYQGRVHRESGRIYRIRNKDGRSKPVLLDGLSDEELLSKLLDPNRWVRQTALQLWSDRPQRQKWVPQLLDRLAAADGQIALELLWTLHRSGGFDQTVAMELIHHKTPQVREWTVRLIGDQLAVTQSIAEELIELARGEPNVHVRSQLASTARRIPGVYAIPLITTLAARRGDAGEIHIPLLLWWALEHHADDQGEVIIDLLRDKNLWAAPLVKDQLIPRLARRWASGKRRDMLRLAKLFAAAPTSADTKQLLTGVEQAFQGRSLAGVPKELADAIAATGGASLALRVRQGDRKAIDEAVSVIRDARADAKQRRQNIELLAQLGELQLVPILLGLVQNDPSQDVRATAISGLGNFDAARIPQELLALLPKLNDDLRAVTVEVLATRSSWTVALLGELKAGRIEKDSIAMPSVRRMLLLSDPQVERRVTEIWGTVRGATTDEMQQAMARIRQVLIEGTGNPYNGREMFAQTCAKCHRLFDKGQNIGPDLTAFKRDDIDNMLLNIVNPSLSIREGYETYVIYTIDGRVLSGLVTDKDNQVVTLRAADGRVHVIQVDDIDEMRAVPTSIMPEGVFKELTDQQLRDLFAYLRGTQPLP
ncbi:MAG: PVC-type heme-binding CxxCH protein [Pirellulaceae bacterium]